MPGPRIKPVGSSAKSLGALAPKITKAAYAAHGFPLAALITDWPAIAGAELAAFTQPERLAWPAGSSARGQGRGATLYVCADGPRALEVQHAASQLIDRLNTHFGYQAVSQIRIVQAPITRANGRDADLRVARDQTADDPAPAPELPTDIEDERLRKALSQLARRVR